MCSVPEESQVIGRFFKVMMPGFRTKLRLPPAYSRKLKDEIPKQAFLTSSRGKWRVEIGQCSRGKLCFLDGWATFVKDHDLKIGEFVIFEQTGCNQFEASLFDSTTYAKEISVEVHNEEEEGKESSAANTEISRTNCSNGRKRGRPQKLAVCLNLERSPSEVHKTEPDLEPDLGKYFNNIPGGRGKPRTRKRLSSPEHRQPSVEILEEKHLGEKLFSPTIKRGRGRPRKTTQSLHPEKTMKYKRNHDKQELPKKTYAEKQPSGRRLPNRVAPDGKQNHFTLKIRSYNIEQSFILYIPALICRSYSISEETRISLIGPSREWHDGVVKKHCLGPRLCMTTGWREFCASNNIEVGDLCFFKIIKTINNEAAAISEFIVMDVKVSRVVPK